MKAVIRALRVWLNDFVLAVPVACWALAGVAWVIGDQTMCVWLGAVGAMGTIAALVIADRR